MSAKHTPGPWRVGRDGCVVCDVNQEGNHKMREEDLSFYEGHLLAESISRDVDARLMAAAPELLEALKAYQTANRIHNDSEAELFEKGERAIAKAEGNEK